MSSVTEHPTRYREDLPKLNPEKKQSMVAPSKSSERKPLKRKIEEEAKEEQKSSEFSAEVADEEEAEGQFELNELMTRVLKQELQTLMIEIWRTLPDKAPTEAERFVAEKLRSEASDDLQNVLGLNITKRLLNVYNPLFVKIRFSCRPESGCLTKFLDQYKVKSFKRINKETNTFAARLHSITDFDNICAAKNIRCGGARIMITPCYRFTLCPKRLNTIFADSGEDVVKVEQKDKVVNENEGDKKIKEKETKAVESNKTEGKPTSILKDKEKEVIKPKETPNKHKNEVTEVKPKENKNQKKEIVLKSPESKTNIGYPKENKNQKEIVLKPPENKTNIENPKENKIVKSPVVKPKQNAAVKVTPKEKQTSIKKSVPKRDIESELEMNEAKINQFNEGDEMNDEEILALISSGVIVDECIGSDDE
ncbi:unnamed protein product [Euphydryas editha]|uniref:Uncharacterized protein n=1 Tax=Euphydryas editha TaxID=104508 RepID=A0AAU9UI46_EUPED|nr:unnamed protein product [Euphydryas editha]